MQYLKLWNMGGGEEEEEDSEHQKNEVFSEISKSGREMLWMRVVGITKGIFRFFKGFM